MGPAELTALLPASVPAALVERREPSAEEVVEAHLGRFAAVNRSLNAVVAVDADPSLADARAADAAP